MTTLGKHINKGVRGIFLLGTLLIFSCGLWAQGYQVRTIVIDPGHGGRDPGAVGRLAKEKDINLNVALLTGGYIEKYLPDVKVIYTRKTDVFVELKKRAEIANKNEADLFISIHVNAVSNSRITGASTWLLGVGKYQSNLELAKLENSVIELEENYEETYQGFDPNKDESYIIFNFNSTKAYFEQSLELAQEIQNQFENRVHRRNYGIHQAPFWVLHQTTMPSVLVELGFITNPDEEKYLMTTKAQELLASAIFRSVRSYKQKIEAKNKKPAKPVIAESTPIVNIPLASKPAEHGVSYKVQFLLSTFELEKNDPQLEGIEDLWQYKEGTFYKYTTGNTPDLSEITEIQAKVKERFPDAFIAAFKDGKRITVTEAKKIIANYNSKN